VNWQKATASIANSACVEVAREYTNRPMVAVRDSKNPTGPVLLFTRQEWAAFLDGARKGEFDHLAGVKRRTRSKLLGALRRPRPPVKPSPAPPPPPKGPGGASPAKRMAAP